MVIQKAALYLAAAMAVSFMVACASQPASTAPAAAPAAPAAVPAVDPTANLDKKFLEAAKSYKTVQREGKTFYCRRESSIGSNIAEMRCLTEAELRNQIQATEELEARTRKGGGGNCARLGNCSGGS